MAERPAGGIDDIDPARVARCDVLLESGEQLEKLLRTADSMNPLPSSSVLKFRNGGGGSTNLTTSLEGNYSI